jgi:hypothetical protein
LATTEKGEKVILLDNGTWKAATGQDVVAIRLGAESKTKIDPLAQETKREEGSISYVEIIRKNSGFDFRQATWGMSNVKVKASEKQKLIREVKDTLFYEYALMGMKCVVSYIFKENQFVSGQYSIEQEHVNPALFNEDYDALKQYLKGLYGMPVSDQDVWKNETYQNDPSQWGFAVSIGFLTRYVVWKGTFAKISLQMSGENHRIFTYIKFSSPKGS